MRPPDFWQAGQVHPAARLLAPLAALYGAIGARRMERPGVSGPCPVICLGNFTLGGAGKTPAALTLARLLADAGERPVFLSRGYGGRLAGPVTVSPGTHRAADVGDEPLLLARTAPTVVARDRVAGAALCRDLGATVIVMDDGLQNPSLTKDLALAVVDAGAGIGNGRVFPAGPLRVPMERQWPYVGGLILIGDSARGEDIALEAERRGCPVHRAKLVPDEAVAAGQRVFAFAGIGRPEKFFATLREGGAEIVGSRAFPDHYPFTRRDLETLADEARRLDATLVSTEKDAVRLPAEFASQVAILKVSLILTEPTIVGEQVSKAIQRTISAR